MNQNDVLRDARKTLAESMKYDVSKEQKEAIELAARDVDEARRLLADRIRRLDELLSQAGLPTK